MPAAARAIALLCLLALGTAFAAPSAPARAESFPMPASIVPRVEFWTRVYSEVGTRGGLIHDSEDLSRVYEVVRAPDGSSDGAVEQRADEAKARARAALRKLAAGQRQNLSAFERRVLAQFPPDVSSRTLSAAAEQVRFQKGQADKFRAGLERMGRWESHIRRALRERGVPEDLKALPHVESSYNPGAHSHAGASGLWQFTRPTGRLYMRVDHIVDERRDPFLASEAAARLLRSNYERLGTWPLAITAYNHGPGGMAKAVRTHGTRDIGVIVSRYSSPSFGFASKNFYCEFLAARRIDQDPERYFGPIRKEAPWDHESVVLRKSYGASALAQALRIPSAELRDWNPALLSPVWSGSRSVPVSYELRVPRRAGHPPASQLVAGIQGQGYQGAPELARRERPASGAGEGAREEGREGVHRVGRGETLGEIAREYGMSARELAELNGIGDPRKIREGQLLEVPGSGPAPASAGPGELASASATAPEPAAQAKAPAEVATIHRVERGETLLSIARRYGVGMATIAARNDIRDPRDLREGQRLEIPVPAPASPAAAGTEVAKAEPPASPATAGAEIAKAEPPAAPDPAPGAAAVEAAEAASEATAPEPARAPATAAEEPAAGASPERDAGAARPEPAQAALAKPEPARPAAAASGAAAVAAVEPEPSGEPPAPRSYVIAPGDTLGDLGRRFGVTPEELAAANGISDPRSLRPGQVLELPSDAAAPGAPAAAERAPAPAPPAERVVAAAQPPPEPPAPRTYTVAPGDTLGSIGSRLGVAAEELAAANGISDPRSLRPGQVLELPGGGAAPGTPAAAEGEPASGPRTERVVAAARPPPEPPAPRTYTVAPGDTLGSIGRRFGVTPKELAAASGVSDPRSLRPGQVLELPARAGAAADAPPAPPPERIYTVRQGDTLYSIAARHGVRVADIAERNSLKSRHKLSIGQRLRLPRRSAPRPSRPRGRPGPQPAAASLGSGGSSRRAGGSR